MRNRGLEHRCEVRRARRRRPVRRPEVVDREQTEGADTGERQRHDQGERRRRRQPSAPRRDQRQGRERERKDHANLADERQEEHQSGARDDPARAAETAGVASHEPVHELDERHRDGHERELAQRPPEVEPEARVDQDEGGDERCSIARAPSRPGVRRPGEDGDQRQMNHPDPAKGSVRDQEGRAQEQGIAGRKRRGRVPEIGDPAARGDAARDREVAYRVRGRAPVRRDLQREERDDCGEPEQSRHTSTARRTAELRRWVHRCGVRIAGLSALRGVAGEARGLRRRLLESRLGLRGHPRARTGDRVLGEAPGEGERAVEEVQAVQR